MRVLVLKINTWLSTVSSGPNFQYDTAKSAKISRLRIRFGELVFSKRRVKQNNLMLNREHFPPDVWRTISVKISQKRPQKRKI